MYKNLSFISFNKGLYKKSCKEDNYTNLIIPVQTNRWQQKIFIENNFMFSYKYYSKLIYRVEK